MRPVCISALAALFSLSAVASAALYDRKGHKIPDDQVNSPEVNWEVLKIGEEREVNGVGLIVAGWWCTGSFLETRGDAQAPAYILTNGHCADPELPGAEEIIVDRAAAAGMIFKLNVFAGAGDREKPFGIRRVAYATMKGRDVAILELDARYQGLLEQGFVPLSIDEARPRVSEPVENLGIPVTGASLENVVLHRSTCRIGEVVNLLEGVYHWEDVVRDRCSSVGGDSGSPMISRRTGRIVAIQSTSVDDAALGEPACALDRPCEVGRDGKTHTRPLENYAQVVAAVPGCFTRDGMFDLTRKGCALERP